MGNAYTNDQISNMFNFYYCYKFKKRDSNPLIDKIDSSNIVDLMEHPDNSVYIYATYKLYDQTNVLYNICKSTNLINQNVILDNICKFYKSNYLINKKLHEKLYNNASTYPQFMLNLCKMVNSKKCINMLLSALLSSHIIQKSDYIEDQNGFVKLLICHMREESIKDSYKQKLSFSVNKYIENDGMVRADLLNLFIEDLSIPYDSYKYLKRILTNATLEIVDFVHNVNNLSNNELLTLLLPCNLSSYNLWNNMRKFNIDTIYSDKMKRITSNLSHVDIDIKYIFTTKDINYCMFILDCFELIPINEIIEFGANIIESDKLRSYKIMRKLLTKAQINKINSVSAKGYKTLLDYYLSTINKQNKLDTKLVDVMIEAGMSYSSESTRIMTEAGYDNKIKLISLI